MDQLEAFGHSLPAESIALNVKGAYATQEIPAFVDELTRARD